MAIDLTSLPPGTLINLVPKRLGIDGPNQWHRCITCGTEFPEIGGEIRCNGHTIDLCPFCRTDSRPWSRGRGL